jgi:hypothetical protein
MPITLDTIQYRLRPLGKVVAKNPNISGIIHSIILLVDSVLGSIAGIIVIFWLSHVETPTRMGMTGVRSGRPRSIHRKELSSGICWLTRGSHE